jgi:membrane protein implicated in regulation of membrane protease activity
MTIGGVVCLLISLVMNIFGFGDAEMSDISMDASTVDTTGGDMDSDAGDYDGGLKLFSLIGFASFCFIMGITGLGFIHAGVPIFLSILTSFILGLGTMYLVAFLFTKSKKLDSDGSVKIESSVGCVGDVYLPFKGNEIGQVQINVNGYMAEYDAVSLDGSSLNMGDKVEVKEVHGSTVRVIKHN